MRFGFKRSFPPTLSASNPNVVSGGKSCQSSNRRQTALFTELKEYICLYSSFIFVFCKRIYPLPPKMKELASITRSTFSAVDFSPHSTDHILAAVGFCCY